MAIDPKLIDELLAGHGKRPQDIAGENGLLKQLTKAILERVLKAELTDHLGYEKHDPFPRSAARSSHCDHVESQSRVRQNHPSASSYSSHSVSSRSCSRLYARGMRTRDIQGHLEEIYGVEASPTLISNVTEAVQDEVVNWQCRVLEPVYPILYMDALYVRMREGGHVQNRAVHVAIGVNLEGSKEVLGLWTAGFTDHVFALMHLLGFRFAPRIRDLADKRLCNAVPQFLVSWASSLSWASSQCEAISFAGMGH